jgi:hypothetical protein
MPPGVDIAIRAVHGKNKLPPLAADARPRGALSFGVPGKTEFTNAVVEGFLVLGESVKMATFRPGTTLGRWGYRTKRPRPNDLIVPSRFGVLQGVRRKHS